jgi:hypothetical protein
MHPSHPKLGYQSFVGWWISRSSKFIRGVGFVFFLFGAISLGHTIYDDGRGIAAPLYAPSRYFHPVEDREKNPQLFSALLRYELAMSLVFCIGGLVSIGLARRGERSDPFSSEFSGGAALDDCERVLDARLEKNHRPLRD